MQFQWEIGKSWSLRRANWLESKYGRKKNIDKILQRKGNKTTDEDLEMFDEIEKINEEDRSVVSEVVKEYLNLTPKFREYENLGIRK